MISASLTRVSIIGIVKKNRLLANTISIRHTDITIKNICREADLSRQTFYQIFESKDEVIEYLFSELFSEFEEQYNYFFRYDSLEIMLLLF